MTKSLSRQLMFLSEPRCLQEAAHSVTTRAWCDNDENTLEGYWLVGFPHRGKILNGVQNYYHLPRLHFFFLMTHLKDSLLVLNRSRHTGDLWGTTTVSLWLGKYCFLTLHKMTCLLIAEGRSNRVYRAARCSSSFSPNPDTSVNTNPDSKNPDALRRNRPCHGSC